MQSNPIQTLVKRLKSLDAKCMKLKTKRDLIPVIGCNITPERAELNHEINVLCCHAGKIERQIINGLLAELK